MAFLTPGIVRPREDGGYEIIAGHRRRHGSELAGLSDMPCIVREMDDDTATILLVDEKKIGMTPAVEISYLKPEEQQMLLTAIDSEQATPSLSQAQRMKKLSRDGKLNDDTMLDIMMEQKKPEGYNVVLSADKLRKYFPRSYTEAWVKKTAAIRTIRMRWTYDVRLFLYLFFSTEVFYEQKEQLKRLICALYRQDEPERITRMSVSEDMLDNIDFGAAASGRTAQRLCTPMKPAACGIAASTIAARRCSRKKRCASMNCEICHRGCDLRAGQWRSGCWRI